MYENAVDLGEVAALALKNGIPVHFIDKYFSNRPKHAGERDEHAAGLVNRITKNTGTTGCLFLYGGAHFLGDKWWYRGSPCLGELLDLPYVSFELS